MKWRVPLALLSGISLYLSFAPINFWLGSYIGVALLFITLGDLAFKPRVFLAFLAGLAFFLPLLNWSGSYVGALPWLILSTGQSGLFALIGIVPYRRRLSSALLFASLFTLIELLRMKFPFSGFGWGRVGFTQLDSIAFLYPYLSITGITFLVVSFAVLATISRQGFVFTLLTVLLFASGNSNLRTTEISKNHLVVAAVQGGVDRLGLGFNNRAFSVLQRHIDETKRINRKVDLIIWPENASDIDPIKNAQAQGEIASLISVVKTPLLLGAVEETDRGPSNSSLLFDAHAQLLSRYVKQELAPFGEYIPLRTLAEALSPQARSVVNFISGKKWKLHEINGIKFGSLICFEVVDDDLVRGAISDGAEFLVAQTNNATFGQSPEADQQLQITRSRAAELGRDIVVVSTTGHTAMINRNGAITNQIPQFRAGVNFATVTPIEERNIASHLGSGAWFFLLIALATLSFHRSVFNR